MLVHNLLRRIDPSGSARITPAAARALFAYAWPRNIRELERALVGGFVRAGDGSIDIGDLPDEIAASVVELDEPATPPGPARPTEPAEDEAWRAELVTALTRHNGDVTAVAKELGKHRQQIYRRVRQFGIDIDSFRR
jgi:transcriptional regulator of acetoin/glycerol metabolism